MSHSFWHMGLIDDWLGTATQALREKEVDEGAADMFLNWVFTKIDQGGFQNKNWGKNPKTSTSECDSGTEDTSNPGDARYNWMDTIGLPQVAQIYGF